jgi:Family of unknown function (DUF6152)
MTAGDWDRIFVIAVLLTGSARVASAHHAFAAEYDANKRIILTGNVVGIEWMNPHAHFQIDARDASGRMARWDLELASPNVLQRGGWTRNSLKVGDVVTVDGYLAKDGTNLAHARDIRLADGRRVLAGSAPESARSQ